MKAKAQWIEGFKFKVDNGRGHEVISDVPLNLKGTDQGPTGLDLTLMGLATCISTVFAMVATNSGIQYNSLSVEIEAQKEKTITNPKAKVCVKSDAPQEKLERILQKSMEICPVGILIEKAGIKIETKLVNEGL